MPRRFEHDDWIPESEEDYEEDFDEDELNQLYDLLGEFDGLDIMDDLMEYDDDEDFYTKK